jgi:hypothetical protein
MDDRTMWAGGGGRYRRKGVTNSEIHCPSVERWIYSARLP